MVTVHSEGGFRVIIYTDDHEPARVHVTGDGEAKFSLIPEVYLEWSRGMTRADVRKALRIVTENQKKLLDAWHEIHG